MVLARPLNRLDHHRLLPGLPYAILDPSASMGICCDRSRGHSGLAVPGHRTHTAALLVSVGSLTAWRAIAHSALREPEEFAVIAQGIPRGIGMTGLGNPRNNGGPS